jgi:uncharacterized protein
MIDLYTALTIGLIGSFHCIGMCGPIAVALPLSRGGYLGKITGTLLYNAGRTITYGLLGALFGLLGKGIEMAGFQQWASIFIGMAMIVSVVFPFLFKEKMNLERLFFGYAGRLISKFRTMFGKQSFSNLFFIGLLNGLLPCGLVYVAVAGAINTNDVGVGIIYMMVFGIGTTPVMITISMAGNVISQSLKAKMNKIIPGFVVFLGILFILRGLSLGIPYISPKTHKLTPDKEIKTEGACCGGSEKTFYY